MAWLLRGTHWLGTKVLPPAPLSWGKEKLAFKPDDLSFIPGTHRKELTSIHLSSDLHTCTLIIIMIIIRRTGTAWTQALWHPSAAWCHGWLMTKGRQHTQSGHIGQSNGSHCRQGRARGPPNSSRLQRTVYKFKMNLLSMQLWRREINLVPVWYYTQDSKSYGHHEW